MVNTKERQAVRSMIIQLAAEGQTLAEISKTFPDICKSTIYRWMQAFFKDGVTDRRPKKNVKREQFREKVLYLQKQGFTVPEIVKTVKSVSSSTVYSWLREEDLQPSSKGEPMMNKTIRTVTKTTPQIKAASNQTPDEEKTREELLAELRKTKAQLQDARILNLLQGKMMEIAERDYGIEFRKKTWCQAIREAKDEKVKLRISYLCGLLGKSKQAFYKVHDGYLLERKVKEQIAATISRSFA